MNSFPGGAVKRRLPLRTAGLLLCLVAISYPGVAQAQVSNSSANAADREASDRVSSDSKRLGDGKIAPHIIPSVEVAAVDFQAVAIEDAADADAGLPPRFAVANTVLITPETRGVWEDVGDGTLMWRLRITSPGAVSLNLGFTRYHMPAAGSLQVFATDSSYIIRPFTAEDNATHGELWTPIVRSDDITVEVILPAALRSALDLELTSINVGYRGFSRGEFLYSGSCNVDVVCSQGDAWRTEIASVAVYSTGGARFCTGSMINNTAQDETPYFLTAAHCSLNSGNAASLVVYWNYETSSCGGNPDGSLADFQTGAFHRATYTTSDFTLMELDSAPDPAWGVTFAGWDRSGADASSAVAIHHPNVDEKRISFEIDPTTVTSYSGTAVPGNGTHVRITDWDLGTTEGGSSGSPLFDQNHHVIGQLHGGGAACGNNSSDWYGRLFASWSGGGSSSSRLSTWLDPGNTGTTSVDTYDPAANPCTSDLECDDGLFCNGTETCNLGSGACNAGSDPCPGQACNELTGLCEAGPAMIFGWDMNSDPGWTTAGQWAWGTPTGGGGQHGGPDPTSGATGSNVFGYNLSGDYPNNLSETHLTTAVIDCTGLSSVSLKFQRWLGVEVSTYDHAYVRVSNNGTSWTTVWQNTAEVADTSWQAIEYDISAVADNQSTVFVRWTIGTTDSSWQYCGWNIDDVEIWALGGSTATCSDGILNQGETRIDCGGPCAACGCTSDGACNDGLFCSGTETCDSFGVCQNGTAVDCNDGVGCTADSCNEATNSCDNIANNGACDDGLFCNGTETCDAVNDCQSGTTVNCNDGVGCTSDSCNEATNSCDNIANNGACDDGLACNGVETCDAVNDCQNGTAVNCNDGVGCTTDTCNDPSGTCSNTPNNAACDNGIFCDGAETCDAINDCQTGTAVDCNDGVGCTDDSCNEATNSCDNVTNDANCDNGLFCDGAETCDAVNDCQAGSDPCPGQTCDEAGNVCVDCQINADCDDGLFCNGTETCAAGVCQAGTAVDCGDAVGCTDDSCNEATNSCDNVANNANCDNGLFCDGTETCDTINDCQAGTAVDCNDAVGCTDDACNEATDSCDNVTNDANCGNGVFCDGAETCDAVNDCQAGSDPCPGQLCDEGTGACVDCLINADCDDGLFCNGTETCTGGVCQAGTAVDCNDGVGCTDDACNEATDSCDSAANDANCDNGLYCDGVETCDAVNDCQAGTAVNCNDAVGCTDDACNEATDSCDNVANDANCGNGVFCDGAETCDAVNDCQAGTAIDCNDGVGCTDDACNEATDSCDNTANNANCPDDGLFCNGTESCDAVSDCVSNGNPCAVNEVCNESAGTCDPQLTGEGFILSRNANLSTDDRTFTRNDTLYMLMWSDQVDFNNISRARWELRDTAGTRLRLPFTNNFDGTYTASFALSGLPSADIDWTWKGEAKDNAGTRYKPTAAIVVLDAPQCGSDPECDDGVFCNGAETCAGGSCQAGSDPCPGSTCDEANDLCVGCLVDGDCDDGLFCNGAETCTAGSCQAGTTVNCDDGVVCTDDACNEGTNSCDNITNDGSCSDGVFCNGAEICDAVSGCQSTAPLSCDDGVGCTDDSCNEATQSCDNIANNGLCPDDGLFCTGTESCDPINDCVSSGSPCAGNEICNEATSACDPGMTGEGYILSLHADFSTDDRTFNRSTDSIYMLLWTDVVDFNDIKKEQWELRDSTGSRIKQSFTNNFDGTWTAVFKLTGLPSNDTNWTWKGKIEDNQGARYRPVDAITVLP